MVDYYLEASGVHVSFHTRGRDMRVGPYVMVDMNHDYVRNELYLTVFVYVSP